MTNAADDYEQMKQLMKPDHQPEIRLFGDIDHAADRIRQTSGSQQGNGGRGHGQHDSEIKRDCPAEREVQRGADETRRVNPQQLDGNAGQRNQPDHAKKDIAARRRHEFENNRRVAARDQHIDHAVVEFFQPPQDGFAAAGEMVHAACGVQRDQRQAEHHGSRRKRAGDGRIEQQPHEQHEQSGAAEHCTDEMRVTGKRLAGFEKCTRHTNSSFLLCRVKNYIMSVMIPYFSEIASAFSKLSP